MKLTALIPDWLDLDLVQRYDIIKECRESRAAWKAPTELPAIPDDIQETRTRKPRATKKAPAKKKDILSKLSPSDVAKLLEKLK
jgi:hypothetical protein